MVLYACVPLLIFRRIIYYNLLPDVFLIIFAITIVSCTILYV